MYRGGCSHDTANRYLITSHLPLLRQYFVNRQRINKKKSPGGDLEEAIRAVPDHTYFSLLYPNAEYLLHEIDESFVFFLLLLLLLLLNNTLSGL